MGVSTLERVASGILAYAITIALMGVCLGFIKGLKVWQVETVTRMKKENAGKNLTLYQENLPRALSGVISGIIVMINSSLTKIVRPITTLESHETQTKHSISVALKLTIARFLNSSFILCLVNTNSKTWFKGGDLVFEANLLMFLMMCQTPVITLMNPTKFIRMFKKRAEKAKGNDSEISQREANELCEGPPIDIPDSISNYMNLIMTCIFYSPMIPQAVVFGMVGTFLNYWMSKYMLLRVHKMPDMFSSLMATFFSNFMPFIVGIWAGSFHYFFY